MIDIKVASMADLDTIAEYDHHVSRSELIMLIEHRRVIVAINHDSANDEGEIVGWLRWNLFWDNTPFVNMIFLLEPFRECGIGKKMMTQWESQMQKLGFTRVMTSTLSNENAQHFYRNIGYKDVGSLLLPNEPLEIIFMKELVSS